ncbi:MAG: hypothetical protein R3360_06045, partial [Alphaproteobacteria bacterium]|nr:hypothetical protein [Alphaproteobacteria bacterium]
GWPNLLLALFHPQGLASRLDHSGGFDRQILRVLEQMDGARPGEQVAGRLTERLEPLIAPLLKNREEQGAQTLPLIPLVLNAGTQKISWFSTIAALGTPLDATLEGLRVELLFPLDEETRTWAEENLS